MKRVAKEMRARLKVQRWGMEELEEIDEKRTVRRKQNEGKGWKVDRLVGRKEKKGRR